MKRNYFSSKNSFTLLILWGIVITMTGLLINRYLNHDLPVVPMIILLAVIGFVVWVLLDTRYVIFEKTLLYRSGPLRGRIKIDTIKKIKKHSGLFVPVTMKPALDTKGFIITYNHYDEVFVSPEKPSEFLSDLQKINPSIEINPQ